MKNVITGFQFFLIIMPLCGVFSSSPFLCLQLRIIFLSVHLSFSSDRVPVRLYLRTIDQDIDDLEDAPTVDSWEKVSYINRPVEVHGEGKTESNSHIIDRWSKCFVYELLHI